ncbi:MAG: SDR family NAD(P)-dependent oxidoreductase [Chloroflexi bacterium]|nr:SDR family NAD(P)-dependent oxidoreductase [Chloroflexota bacterium]
MEQILVTGAAGFIGAEICSKLAGEGYRVIGLDNLNSLYDTRLKSYRLNLLQELPGFRFIKADITDEDALESIFSNNQLDAVINIAGVPGVRLSVENPWLFVSSNTVGTLNLLDCCRRHDVKKFLQASTSSVYGDNAPYPTPESADTTHPLQPYAVSKLASEQMCYAYHSLHGIDATVLRFFTVFGPCGRPDMAIFRFIKWIDEGQPVLVNGDGTQTRGFTYVEDIANGTLAALRHSFGYEIFNLGGHESISINDLITKIEKLVGKKASIRYQPMMKADMTANLADITKARAKLDWHPEVSLDEGLKRTVDWYMNERFWVSDIRIS